MPPGQTQQSDVANLAALREKRKELMTLASETPSIAFRRVQAALPLNFTIEPSKLPSEFETRRGEKSEFAEQDPRYLLYTKRVDRLRRAQGDTTAEQRLAAASDFVLTR